MLGSTLPGGMSPMLAMPRPVWLRTIRLALDLTEPVVAMVLVEGCAALR
ncbi:Uncharacterised protein [Mycobacteroides abscessus subsp. abscessus]|nr:Uncharacterised protein [Mycobacteroides abscessus subsp. abscessus]